MNKNIIIGILILGLILISGCKENIDQEIEDEIFINDCVEIAKLDYGFREDEEHKMYCKEKEYLNLNTDCLCALWKKDNIGEWIEHNNSWELKMSNEALFTNAQIEIMLEGLRWMEGSYRLIKAVHFNIK